MDYIDFIHTYRFLIAFLAGIGTFLTVLKFYKKVLMAAGLFLKRKFRPTEKKHKYAICIAARNERAVIKNLLDSIDNQDYPMDKLSVFVVADNCTDDTAEIVENYKGEHLKNVFVYRHENPEERTKGFALRYLFDRIIEDRGIETYDAFFVFDADNVLCPDYITRMNEAFDEGYKIVTSFRNSKNASRNWISFSYAMHWWRTCLGEHRANSFFHIACRIQGTGFMFSNELVRNGWKYTSLTEDRAFCTDAVVMNYDITYCEAAMFYDEQPYKLKVALRQRLRWAKGHLLSTVENEPKLIKNLFVSDNNLISTYNCFWLNFPGNIETGARRLLTIIFNILIGVYYGELYGYLIGFVVSTLTALLKYWLENMGSCVFVLIWYRKRIDKIKPLPLLFYVFMFPFFDKIGKWSMYVALFRHVEWKPIPHDTVTDISTLKSGER